MNTQLGTEATSESETAVSNLEESASRTIDECNGRKACIDATVLRALFSSSLLLENSATFEQTPASELVAYWLAVEGTNLNIRVEPSEEEPGTHQVSLTLWRVTEEDGGMDITFDFRLNGDRIVDGRGFYLPISWSAGRPRAPDLDTSSERTRAAACYGALDL